MSMRKERPTYAVWLDESVIEQADGTPRVLEPMPPIRCVVEPPCGDCWYCKQWADK